MFATTVKSHHDECDTLCESIESTIYVFRSIVQLVKEN